MDQEHSNRGGCVSLSREKGQDVNSQCSVNTYKTYMGRGLSETMVCAAVSHDIYSHWWLRGNNLMTTLDVNGVKC